MKDQEKTQKQLMSELAELRQRIAELEKSETKRKQAEEALRESEEKYRNIVETAPDGIVTVDLKGIVTSCNSAFTSITGFSESEIVGKHFSKLPTLRARDIPNYIKLFNSLIRGKVPKQFEARWLHKDGTAYWAEVRLSLMRRGRKIIGLQAIARDITERKRAEEALRESEGRFRDIAENALEWIWEVDANGKYTYASAVVEKILGYKPVEVLKKHFYDLFHPEDREELKKAAFEVFAKKQSFREFINRNVHKNGKTVWLSTSGVPILDEKGNLLGYRGADTDITERKRAEEEVQCHLNRLAALREIDRAISSTLDLSQVLDIILEQLERVIPYTSAAIFLLTDDIAKVTAGRGFPDMEQAMQVSFSVKDDALFQQILEEKRPLVLADAQADERFRARGGTEYVRSWLGVPLIVKGKAIGFLTIDHREPGFYDEKSAETALAFATQAAIAVENAQAYERLKTQNLQTISALAAAVEAKDPYTSGHSEKVTQFAIAIAEKMGLSHDEIEDLRVAALLHDIGKIGIPDSVLNKPARLTSAEFLMVKTHPVITAEIVERVEALAPIVATIRHHHERWDGTGYPDGLKGEDIPLLARILAVADAFQAMTSERPYRRARTEEEALAELEKGAGIQWDPKVVEVFVKTYEEGALKHQAGGQ